MRRTRSRHVGRSVVIGATTPNRNGLVMPGLLSHRRMSGLSPATRRSVACRQHFQTPLPPGTHRCPVNWPDVRCDQVSSLPKSQERRVPASDIRETKELTAGMVLPEHMPPDLDDYAVPGLGPGLTLASALR